MSAACSAASRLCTACGLCCNGVMFHTVRLQPRDSAKELTALGLKLKRKKGQRYILQPCPAWREAGCTIYASRPERCRLFECQQLQRVAAGEISEADALEKIREAQRLVDKVNTLVQQSGTTDPRRPLTKRFEKVTAEPVEAAWDAAGAALRAELTGTMRQLEELLDRDFRNAPLPTDLPPSDDEDQPVPSL